MTPSVTRHRAADECAPDSPGSLDARMSGGVCRGLLRRWLSFNSVGIMGTGVQLVTLMVLMERLKLDLSFATGLAVEAAILHNFVWHERWTWRDRRAGDSGQRWWDRLFWFHLVSGTLSLVGNVGFTGLYSTAFGLHYVPSNLMAIASCSLLNFVANDRLVFRALGDSQMPVAASPCAAHHSASS